MGGFRRNVNFNKQIYLSAPHMGGQELDFVHEAFDYNCIVPLGPRVVVNGWVQVLKYKYLV